MKRTTSWMGVLGLALAMTVAACAGDGEDMEAASGDTAMEQTSQAEESSQMAMDAPACEPTSEGAELEGRSSPYDSATVSVGEGVAKVCYSRPSLRGRTMIGGEAVPYGELWRTGANEPTIVHVTAPTAIAGIEVEPGAYSLYTIPEEGEEWMLIVNRSTSQWGHEGSYTEEVEAQEVGRATVQVESLDQPVEQLTFRAMEDGSGMVLEWQNSRVLIPVSSAG